MGLIRAGIGVAVSLLAMACLGPAAHAAKSVDRFIGGPSGDALGAFNSPADVAVNESNGKIYVADESNDRIVRLSAGGAPELTWGRDVIAGNADTGYEICTFPGPCKRGENSSIDGSDAHASGEFIRPSGVAVDPSDGSVYVWDTRGSTQAVEQNVRIQKFDAGGNFILMFGRNVNATKVADSGATQAQRDVCTAASGDVCRQGTAGSAPGQLGQSADRPSLAIGPGPAFDVFVADPANRRIQRFTSSGAFVATFGTTTQFPSAGLPRQIAVDSQGIVFAGDSTASGRIHRYDSAGVHSGGVPGFMTPIAAPPLLVGTATATSGLEVDRATGALYVLRDPTSGDTVIQQFDDPDTPVAPTTVSDTHGSGGGFGVVRGLGLNGPDGILYVSGAFGVGMGVFAFDDDGAGPISASGVSASAVTATSANLVGDVDPGDGLVTHHFEYSSDGVNYTSTPVRQLDGVGPTTVNAPISGLDPNSLYRVRLIVRKVTGPATTVEETSTEQVFVTAAAPPAVTTLGPADRTDTSALLRGAVDPNGSSTTYRFEYGPAGGSFDRQVPVPDGNAGQGNNFQDVSQLVVGLQPATRYHYRIVAQNSAGPAVGDAIEFTTQPVTPLPPEQGARAYELVSPADKVGGVGVGEWYRGPGSIAGSSGFAAYEGERFASQGVFGSMLTNGAHGYGNDWAFAERRDSQIGWVNRSPLTHPNYHRSFPQYMDIRSTSADMSRVFWGSQQTAVIFPELDPPAWQEFDGGLLSDWDGDGPGTRWELLGPWHLDQVTPSASGRIWNNVQFSADGDVAVGETALSGAGRSQVVGLAGSGDPSTPAVGAPSGDINSGKLLYEADVSAGLADTLAGTGARRLVSACTGTAGEDRTKVPVVNGSGDLTENDCGPLVAGRSAKLVSDRGAALLDRAVGPTGAVSEDGSRVFFIAPDPRATGVPNGTSGFCQTAGEVCPPQLFVRQRDSEGNIDVRWISRAQSGLLGTQDATLTGSVRFEGATPDGDKVFFRTNSPLTADDPNGAGSPPPAGGVKTGTASNSSWDLYMYDLPDAPGADPASGSLTRISGGPNGASDCNVPVALSTGAGAGLDTGDAGALRFLSDDGRTVLFSCAAPLAGVGEPGNGTITRAGGSATSTAVVNLYLHSPAASSAVDRWRFVAQLSRAADSPLVRCASVGVEPRGPMSVSAQDGPILLGTSKANCVRGTADGRFVTFATSDRLTADDPVAVPTGDIYGYDSVRDELTRITAPQGGIGGAYMCAESDDPLTPDPTPATLCYGDGGADYSGVPAPALGLATEPLVPGDRLAFFQSRSRLVVEDKDDAYDVYQWRNGELSLLSTGSSTSDGAFYKGNDRTGRNVFMATRDRLTWQDFDASADIYTARVGGGIEQPPDPVTCAVLVDLCQGPGAAPISVVRDVAPGEGNAQTRSDPQLAFRRLTARAKRAAAGRGKLTVRLRTSAAGTVRFVARARMGGRKGTTRLRRVARARVRATKAGTISVRLKLNAKARRVLRNGDPLPLVVTAVGFDGGASDELTTVLRRGSR